MTNSFVATDIPSKKPLLIAFRLIFSPEIALVEAVKIVHNLEHSKKVIAEGFFS